MKSSMSRKSNCWGSAPTESLWGRLKVGRLYGRKFETRRTSCMRKVGTRHSYYAWRALCKTGFGACDFDHKAGALTCKSRQMTGVGIFRSTSSLPDIKTGIV